MHITPTPPCYIECTLIVLNYRMYVDYYIFVESLQSIHFCRSLKNYKLIDLLSYKFVYVSKTDLLNFILHYISCCHVS